MPEASMHKHRDLLVAEPEIGAARKTDVAAPTRAERTQQLTHALFGSTVTAAADGRHQLRPFFP
jgi:hypothetical protein